MSPERVTTEVDGRRLTLSNLDKVLYPETGFTKGQVLDYYARVAPVLLPHVADRPLTMHRYAEGVGGPGFYEKHAPRGAPEWVRTATVASEGKGREIRYLVLCDLASLLWVVNLASLELHVPGWRVGRRRRLPGPPDHLVIDLDPGPGTTIADCATVALAARAVLADDGLDPVAKTSGSKGLHLLAALDGRPGWDTVRRRAHDLARRLERELPDLVVSNMRKDLRQDKVLFDWSQNHPAKTTVVAYSLRARPTPTVSTPVTWDEVADGAESGDPGRLVFGPDEVLERVERMGDLFAPLAGRDGGRWTAPPGAGARAGAVQAGAAPEP